MDRFNVCRIVSILECGKEGDGTNWLGYMMSQELP
jgi:hypothetical protein